MAGIVIVRSEYVDPQRGPCACPLYGSIPGWFGEGLRTLVRPSETDAGSVRILGNFPEPDTLKGWDLRQMTLTTALIPPKCMSCRRQRPLSRRALRHLFLCFHTYSGFVRHLQTSFLFCPSPVGLLDWKWLAGAVLDRAQNDGLGKRA